MQRGGNIDEKHMTLIEKILHYFGVVLIGCINQY